MHRFDEPSRLFCTRFDFNPGTFVGSYIAPAARFASASPVEGQSRSEKHAAGCFNSLTGDPKVVVRQQGSDRAADIVRQADTPASSLRSYRAARIADHRLVDSQKACATSVALNAECDLPLGRRRNTAVI
jgi:hypothetical protein